MKQVTMKGGVVDIKLEDRFCQSISKNWKGISPPGLPVPMKVEVRAPVINLSTLQTEEQLKL